MRYSRKQGPRRGFLRPHAREATWNVATIGLLVSMFMGGLLLITGCDTSQKCMSYKGSMVSGSSTAHFLDCGDKQAREVECDESGSTHECRCIVGGSDQKTFERNQPFPQSFESAQAAANQACGWKLHR